MWHLFKSGLIFKFYVTALFLFVALDMVWLGVIAKNFYARQIGFLMKDNVLWPAAIVFYLIYIAGLTVFVLVPSWQQKSMLLALCLGAFWGLVTYATYDLTNLATLKNWPIALTVVDIFWGTILSAIVSLCVLGIFRNS